MDITLNKKTNTDASIKVTLNEADYQSKVNEKLKDYSKKAQIKGFRPGKVPPTLIKKMYGKSVLAEEINQMLNQHLSKFIKENQLPIVGEPLPDNENEKNIDWDNQKDFEFEYNVGLHSDFDYNLNNLGPQIKYIVKVDDQEVEETIERLRTQYAKMTPVETSERGDFIYGDLTSSNEIEHESMVLPTSKIEEAEVDKFIGLAKDQTVSFDINKVFGNDQAKIAAFLGIGKEETEALNPEFQLKVTDIKRSETAELNQDFFDIIFGKDNVITEEDFRNKVKETLQNNFSAEGDTLLTKKIYESLIEKTEIELPEVFLKDYLFLINQGKIQKEEIEKESPIYFKEIKWSLIRNKIIKDSGYKVSEEDLKEEARKVMTQKLAQMRGGYPGMDELIDTLADNYLKAENGKNVNSLLDGILFSKTISYIKENITIEEKEINKEEFTKLASN